MWNSFQNANTTVILLDNGLISVCGTSYADFRGPVALMTDTLSHSIVAQFSQDFTFLSGMMISSGQASNYFNTVTSQRPEGTVTYSRFVENNRLYNENILYGSIHGNRIFRERFYQEQNRSSQVASSFLYPLPNEDIVIQTFWDSTAGKGGLEILRIRDVDTTAECNGRDTSLSFLQPYSMDPSAVTFDSVMTNTFHQTYHNEVSVSPGSMSIVTACRLSGGSVQANPVISLDKDSVLCLGSQRQLNAGSGFAHYSWSNGNTDSVIMVTDTGRYWVSVLGQDGCRGSDTTHIARLGAMPAGFLPPDTTICEYSKLTIAPSHSYQSYLWSDQSTGPTLTVTQPGTYALLVTDSNQCTGSDSIRLTQKTCVLGLYVPNAFTPNGDGRNDLFRPLLVGNIVWFRFSVYNRWGQKVFETSEAGRGWDGKVNGTPAQDDAFVWYCQYQLVGEPQTIKKGTVLLIH
jgi:gliding motility-associated-like protein